MENEKSTQNLGINMTDKPLLTPFEELKKDPPLTPEQWAEYQKRWKAFRKARNLTGEDFHLCHRTFPNNLNIRGKNLSGWEINRSHLIEADATKANLTGTSFRNSYLNGAKLIEATLTDTKFIDTDLSDVDLSSATGLIPGQLEKGFILPGHPIKLPNGRVCDDLANILPEDLIPIVAPLEELKGVSGQSHDIRNRHRIRVASNRANKPSEFPDH